jgi:uncharacterized protein (TIGR03435 family)
MAISAPTHKTILSVIASLVLVSVSRAPIANAGQNSPNAAHATFEAASVKYNKSGPPESVSIGFAPDGGLRATNVTLLTLVATAYGDPRPLPDFLIEGPKGIDSDRFDVVAKAGSGPPPTAQQRSIMLQHLLADRFKLVIHKETRQLPMYALVVANQKLGPGLRKSSAQCDGAAPANQRVPCGLRRFPGTLNGTGITLVAFARALTPLRGVERPVVDQTNLDGAYDIDLKWTPEQLLPETKSPPPGAPPMPAIDPNGPSLFTALQEQLGLKLNSTKAPVDIVVVDRFEPPTSD